MKQNCISLNTEENEFITSMFNCVTYIQIPIFAFQSFLPEVARIGESAKKNERRLYVRELNVFMVCDNGYLSTC